MTLQWCNVRHSSQVTAAYVQIRVLGIPLIKASLKLFFKPSYRCINKRFCKFWFRIGLHSALGNYQEFYRTEDTSPKDLLIPTEVCDLSCVL